MLDVLIVDDDRNLCECLFKLIKWNNIGCNPPFVAYNGLEAWKLVKQQKIDFIVCDLKMPVLGGAELCERIKREFPEIKIVFLSAYEDFAIARKALQFGVTDYILKPVNRESLEKLQRIIERVVSEKGAKRFYAELLGGEYYERILDAMYKKDMGYMEEILEQTARLEDFDMWTACTYILHILYDYMCLIHGGADRRIYDVMYRKWCHELKEIAIQTERILYVRSLFLREFQETDVETDAEFIVRRIKLLVKDNFAYLDCNIDWVAGKLHLSAAYIGRIFSRETGIPLKEYITGYRIKQACELLAEENIPVNEIAMMVGYSNANYFIKVFRDKMGVSPMAYRKKSTN